MDTDTNIDTPYRYGRLSVCSSMLLHVNKKNMKICYRFSVCIPTVTCLRQIWYGQSSTSVLIDRSWSVNQTVATQLYGHCTQNWKDKTEIRARSVIFVVQFIIVYWLYGHFFYLKLDRHKRSGPIQCFLTSNLDPKLFLNQFFYSAN